MPPSETEILTSYLIQPSSLTSITTLDRFKSLFPRPLQSSPQVRTLYRDLQAQRTLILDRVADNIAEEAGRGDGMRHEMLRQRLAAEQPEIDPEVEMERALFGDSSGAQKAHHTLTSIIPELDGAATALEAEIEKLQADEAELLEAIKQTIGRLSDLRSGKFANAQLKDEITDSLNNVEAVCGEKS